ncbi:MAG: restriction endonuclease subunit S [Bradymonadia bacterium]
MSTDLPRTWRLGRFRDVLKESRLPGTNGATAQKLTVRLYGKGVVPKVNDRGSAATVYYRRKAGQFIYSKLDFLNGAFGLIPPELDGFESTSDLPCFDIRGEVDPTWLVAHVSRPAFYKRYRGSAIGSRKAQRVSPAEFLASRVTFPPLDEQVAIGACIDRVAGAIASTEALIQQLRISKHQSMRELLTLGHPRFRTEMQPLPSTWPMGRVAPNIEEIPAHWQLVQLTKIARLESGHTPSRKRPEYWDGEIPWISLTDSEGLRGLEIRDTTQTIGTLGLANSSARLLPKGTVVLLRTASVGLCSKMGREMATSQHFANWVCGPKLQPDYLVQVFRHMDREWKRLQAGSVLPDIYMPVFKKIRILLPPPEEQEVIADVGRAFDTRIEAETRYLAELTEMKRGLAKELLSGRVRMPAELIAKLNDTDGRVSE